MWSHKFNGPGLAYELALSLFESKLVWLNGPLPPGPNKDPTIYKSALKQKIPTGKLAIADKAYEDRSDPKLSTPNALDPEDLRKFKARAAMRQETFNGRIKRFACLQNPFRHSKGRHETCFVAICVICQYEMELVSPVFDI